MNEVLKDMNSNMVFSSGSLDLWSYGTCKDQFQDHWFWKSSYIKMGVVRGVIITDEQGKH